MPGSQVVNVAPAGSHIGIRHPNETRVGRLVIRFSFLAIPHPLIPLRVSHPRLFRLHCSGIVPGVPSVLGLDIRLIDGETGYAVEMAEVECEEGQHHNRRQEFAKDRDAGLGVRRTEGTLVEFGYRYRTNRQPFGRELWEQRSRWLVSAEGPNASIGVKQVRHQGRSAGLDPTSRAR